MCEEMSELRQFCNSCSSPYDLHPPDVPNQTKEFSSFKYSEYSAQGTIFQRQPFLLCVAPGSDPGALPLASAVNFPQGSEEKIRGRLRRQIGLFSGQD